jgi:hypothetical protein
MNPHADTDAAHRAAFDALPWLLNGSLGAAEREAVQAHVQSCAACRDELDMLGALRVAGQDSNAPVLDPERGLARILPRLDARPAPKAQPPGVLQRWRARLAANERAWLRGAMVAQAVVIAGLLLALVRPDGFATAPYRVLGAHVQDHAALVIVFRPQTTESELRRIVRASGARIVDGPTVTDAYLVSVNGSKAAALARLRAEPGVALAEPLQPEGQP